MSKKGEEMLFDKRIVDRNLRAGAVTQGDYQSYLKSLPDEAKNAEEHQIWEEPTPEDTGLTFSSISHENTGR